MAKVSQRKAACPPPMRQLSEAGLVGRLYWGLADSAVLIRRNLTHLARQRQLLAFSTIQPATMLVLFVYVFGGAISFVTRGDYIDYLLPGIVIMSVMFSGAGTAVGLSADISQGIIERLRSLPISRAVVLIGRTGADTLRGAFTVAFMITVGYVIGFRMDDWGAGLAGILLTLYLTHAIAWVGAAIGLMVREPEAAQIAAFLWVFPFAFASSIFVPTFTMPSWLRPFAENQPFSVIASTVRDLITGTVNGDEIAASLLWISAVIAVAMPLAVRQYAKVASR